MEENKKQPKKGIGKRILAMPATLWNRMDTKKTDSWLAAILGICLRTSGLILLVFALLVIWRMLGNTGFALQSFSIPKTMEENGISGSIAAIRLQDAIQALKDEAASVKKDELEVSNGESDAAMNVQVMGLEVSLNSIAYQLRYLLGRPQKRITGEIVRSGSKYSLLFRMSGYPNVQYEVTCTEEFSEDCCMQLIRQAAETVLERTDPYRLAVVQYRRKNYDIALQLVRQTIRDRPTERAWAYNAWGNILFEQGLLEAAIDKFQQATILDPGLALPYLRWGSALLELKREDEGIAVLEKSTRISKQGSPDLWLTLGWYYMKRNEPSKSDSAYARVVAESKGTPFETKAWQFWIGSKMDFGDMAGAKEIAQKALETASETSEGYITRGIAYFLQQDTIKAINAYRRALEIDPRNGLAIDWVLGGYALQKKYTELINTSKQLLNSDILPEKRPDVYNYLAMGYNYTGQYDSAWATIRYAITLDSMRAAPYSTLAECYGFAGKKRQFYYYLEKSLGMGLPYIYISWDMPPYNRFRHEKRAIELQAKYGPSSQNKAK